MSQIQEADLGAQPPLGRAVSRALGWSTLAQLIGRLGNLALGIALARLLTKEDFGAYAVTIVAVNLLIVTNDLGVIAAVIRWQGEPREPARTAATLAIVSSSIIFLVACLAAGPFARALGSPSAANLVRVVAIVILIDGISAAHQAMLVRTFRNDRLAIAELAGFVVGTPVTVALAILGAGPWSIVLGRVVGAAAVGAMVIRAAPFSIRLGFDRPIALSLLRFGAPLALTTVVSQAVLNVDYVVVGRELGAVELGVYLLAFNLSSWPASLVSTAIARVAFAGFSRLVSDRDRLTSAFPRCIGVALSLLVPLVVLLVVLAPEVIELLYGSKWLAAATPLRFLALLGGMRIVIDLLMDLSIADGRPGTALRVRLVWLVAVVPALAVGATIDGLRGVGIAHVLVAAGVVLPWLLVDVRRSGIASSAIARQSARPLFAGAIATVVMIALLHWVSGDLLQVAVVGAAGSFTYVALLVPGNPLVGWVVSRVGPAKAVAA